MPFVRGLLKEVVIATTESQKLPTVSEKARKIHKIVTEHPNIDPNYRAYLSNLLSELIGEKINPNTTQPMLFSAIVFTSNTNGHNYSIGSVHIYDPNGNVAWKKDGSRGNNTSCDRSDGSWRFATREEIEAAFKE